MGYCVEVDGVKMMFTRKPTQKEIDEAKPFVKELKKAVYKKHKQDERATRDKRQPRPDNPGQLERRAARKAGIRAPRVRRQP